ncbi:MAG: sialidase family protein [Planctomycetaceae bacterium]
MLQIVDQGILSHQPGRGAYMPVMSPLSDGSFIACQHVGSELGSADNRIEALRSHDGGRTWTQQNDNLAALQEEGWSYRGPDVAEFAPGKLVITATRFEATGGQLFDPNSEALQRPEMLLFRSSDNGKSWTGPETVPVDLDPSRHTWNGAGGLLRTSPDRWLYGFETWKPEGYTGPPNQMAGMVVSRDQGRTWGELTVVAKDPAGDILYWDQMNCRLPDGRIYTMFWTHQYGTHTDTLNHWSVSSDEGRTWSKPRPTNLPGQVCSPIALADGRVAAIYNHRIEPQGIRVALSDDLENFDRANEVVVFDAGAEALLGVPESDAFFAHHQKIGFGKPAGHRAEDGTIVTYFWCTSRGVTHTRWVRLRA